MGDILLRQQQVRKPEGETIDEDRAAPVDKSIGASTLCQRGLRRARWRAILSVISASNG
jgi:hypothetical protein